MWYGEASFPRAGGLQGLRANGLGLELEPVIVQLGRWGARSPSKPRDAALSVDSLILSFRTIFDPRTADELEATYELRLGEYRFRAVVEAINERGLYV